MQDITELFRLYRNDVYRLAVSYTHSLHEAEDICQIVFLKLMEQENITTGKEKAWLMQVTANQCRSMLRSNWWNKRDELDEMMPDQQPIQNEMLQSIMELKPKYRVAIYLFYYEGYTTDEIAGMLHIKQSAVTTRLSRARKILREEWKEVCICKSR